MIFIAQISLQYHIYLAPCRFLNDVSSVALTGGSFTQHMDDLGDRPKLDTSSFRDVDYGTVPPEDYPGSEFKHSGPSIR